MRTIKLFEEFHNKSIDDICRQYNITNYTINEDGSIDVNGNVSLSYSGLNELPLKFNYVSGNFDCYCNKLTNLDGCPTSVGGEFDCAHNQLKSLKGCPTSVGDVFNCDGNPVYEIWKLIDDEEYLEVFLDYDMVDGDELNLIKLNDLLDMIGKPKVTSVKGYKCI